VSRSWRFVPFDKPGFLERAQRSDQRGRTSNAQATREGSVSQLSVPAEGGNYAHAPALPRDIYEAAERARAI
jgi:hypothetical protein